MENASAIIETTQSEDIKELVAALVKVQAEIQPATKDKTNPFFHKNYADLSDVWAVCREPLSQNGLAVIQTMDGSNGNIIVVTTLAHISGQWMKGKLPIKPVKDDPQAIGSAITYGRRYSLSAIVGVVSEEDDDGEGAMGRGKGKDAKRKPPQIPIKPSQVSEGAPQSKIREKQVADAGKTDKLDFSGRINCPEQIDSEGNARSIVKATCKTCDKRSTCTMWQNTPPESQDGGQAATSPDDAGASTPKYNIPDKIPWTGKAAMIAMLRELQEKEPLAFSGMAVYYEVEPTKFNALTEQQAWEFYRDVLKAANEGGK